ncbi:ribonuclease T2, partial [Rhizoclosmatium globosum]
VSALPASSVFGTCSADSRSCKGDVDFCCVPNNGHLTLILKWMPGICATNSMRLESCHDSSIGTNGCDTNRQYSSITGFLGDSELYQELEKYWASTSPNSLDSLLKLEWQRHGTCYSPANVECAGGNGADVGKFFGDVVAAHKTYNIFNILSKAGINPNGLMYSKSKFDRAITSAF